jgi:hypothetical protein
MTKANHHSSAQNANDDDDDMLPEYDFSGSARGVRGKYAQTIREQGYSVTVHHEDGTSTTRYVSPSEVMEQNRDRERNRAQHLMQREPMASEKTYTWYGDRITGDQVMGDKFTGDKVMGNKVQIGTVQGDAIAGNTIVSSQNLAEAAEEIQDLIEQLAKTYPTETMPAKVEFAGAVVRQIAANPSLSQRLLSASKAGGVAALGQVLNHPLASFVIAAIEDWQKTKEA